MIIKALILTTLLANEPTIVAMPPAKTEASRKRSKKGMRGRKRGGGGLR
jgi:hypothetical protein